MWYTHLIAMLFDFKWFQRWFISSRRRCNITASSCDVSEPNNFLPVPSRRSYTTRCVSISDCKSCAEKIKSKQRKMKGLYCSIYFKCCEKKEKKTFIELQKHKRACVMCVIHIQNWNKKETERKEEKNKIVKIKM